MNLVVNTYQLSPPVDSSFWFTYRGSERLRKATIMLVLRHQDSSSTKSIVQIHDLVEAQRLRSPIPL